MQPDHIALCESLESRRLLAGATLSSVGTLEVIGTRKADTIWVTYGPNSRNRLFVRINKEEFSFTFKNVKRITIQSGPSDDHIQYRGFALDPEQFQITSKIYGSTGNDTIIAGAAATRVYGGTGNDKIFGNHGRDVIYGEEGADTLDGGNGTDYMSGGDDNDSLIGGLGFDRLFGDLGNDTFFARGDLPAGLDTRPFLAPESFDALDGGDGTDRADADPIDRLVNIESTFRAP
jgi:hypothetical protein